MKVFRIVLDVVSTSWETVDAFVEAETLEEAIKLFKDDPDCYDWDNWETTDSEVHSWEVNEEECRYAVVTLSDLLADQNKEDLDE